MTKKKCVDLDTRPYPNPLFRNYDYGGPKDGYGIGAGTGLYHGEMDRYKSVKEFIDKKLKRQKRRKALAEIVFEMNKQG